LSWLSRSIPSVSGTSRVLPGPGNLTGLAWAPAVEIIGKHMEFLREVVPNLSRVAVLVDPGFPGIGPYRDAAERAAMNLHLTYREIETREADDFSRAFATIFRERSQAVFIQGSPLVFRHLHDIVDLAASHRIPAIFVYREAVPLGGLMSYGVSLADLYRRAATFVVKILHGAKPADLPVEQPTKFELVINMKTAKALGLTIPQSLLLRADQLIE
jgi:putative ABC transport system substrate-binding protein